MGGGAGADGGAMRPGEVCLGTGGAIPPVDVDLGGGGGGAWLALGGGGGAPGLAGPREPSGRATLGGGGTVDLARSAIPSSTAIALSISSLKTSCWNAARSFRAKKFPDVYIQLCKSS
jgi:hypothetical protein